MNIVTAVRDIDNAPKLRWASPKRRMLYYSYRRRERLPLSQWETRSSEGALCPPLYKAVVDACDISDCVDGVTTRNAAAETAARH